MSERPTIALTVGEPAGIGPEIVARLAERHAAQPFPARLVVLGDRALLAARAARIGVDAAYVEYDPRSFSRGAGVVEVWHLPLIVPAIPGYPDPANAGTVVRMLEHACDACATGAFAALVTAPVQKATLQDAGIAFSGHTEFLAARTHTPRVVMLLVGGDASAPLRVALVTTHLPLAEVAASITHHAVAATIAITTEGLERWFGIRAPKLAVCGLNPHAGEGGHLGREEIEHIAPAIATERGRGRNVVGPLAADTLFVPGIARRYDAIVAMYHDQGLPALKAVSFGRGVNVTLGLPFVRTSVDHGTALDLAANAEAARGADAGSLIAATELAIELTTTVGQASA